MWKRFIYWMTWCLMRLLYFHFWLDSPSECHLSTPSKHNTKLFKYLPSHEAVSRRLLQVLNLTIYMYRVKINHTTRSTNRQVLEVSGTYSNSFKIVVQWTDAQLQHKLTLMQPAEHGDHVHIFSKRPHILSSAGDELPWILLQPKVYRSSGNLAWLKKHSI